MIVLTPTITLYNVQIAALAEKEAITQRNKEMPKVKMAPSGLTQKSCLPVAQPFFNSQCLQRYSQNNQRNIHQNLKISAIYTCNYKCLV